MSSNLSRCDVIIHEVVESILILCNFQEVDTEASIIGYFDSSSNAEDLETFKELATTDGRTYRFAFTTSKAVLEAKKYDGCAVVVFPPPKYVNEKMERSKFRYPSKSIANRQQQLLDFIQAKSIPLAGELTSRTSAAYEAVNKPLVTVFGDIDYERNAKNVNYLANRVRKVAKKYEGKVIFSLADTKAFETVMEEDYAFEKVSYKEAQVGLRSEDMFYHMTDKFSVENLASFVDQFLAGSLEGKQKVCIIDKWISQRIMSWSFHPNSLPYSRLSFMLHYNLPLLTHITNDRRIDRACIAWT